MDSTDACFRRLAVARVGTLLIAQNSSLVPLFGCVDSSNRPPVGALPISIGDNKNLRLRVHCPAIPTCLPLTIPEILSWRLQNRLGPYRRMQRKRRIPSNAAFIKPVSWGWVMEWLNDRFSIVPTPTYCSLEDCYSIIMRFIGGSGGRADIETAGQKPIATTTPPSASSILIPRS